MATTQTLSKDVRDAVVSHIIRFELLRRQEFRKNFLSRITHGQIVNRAGRIKQSTWDVVIALSEAYLSNQDLATSDIYLLTGLSRTTAGRCMNVLSDLGVIDLANDSVDKRRTNVRLNKTYRKALDSYVRECFVEFEELFKVSEDRFLKVFQASPVLQSITRLTDGVIVEVNEAWLKTLGFQREEVIGSTALEIDVLVDFTMEKRLNLLNFIKENRGGNQLEAQLRCKNGEVRDVIYSGEIINFAGDDHLLIISQDNTEQKRAEESQKKFLDALENVPEGIILWDADSKFVMCNEQFRRIRPDAADYMVSGASFEDFIRKRAKSGLIKEALGREEDWIAERLASRQKKEFSEHEVQADERWFRIRETKLAGGGVINLYTDITDEKKLSEALKENEQKMSQVLMQYSQLFDHAIDGILLRTRDSREIIECNEVCARNLGYSREELIGKKIDLFSHAQPELDRDARLARLKPGSNDRIERVHRKKDGTKMLVEVSSSSFIIDDRVFVLSFIRDATSLP